MTSAQSAASITGTRNDTNAVATLDNAPRDPPTVADYEALRAKLNELILAAGRYPGHAGVLTGTRFFLDPLREFCFHRNVTETRIMYPDRNFRRMSFVTLLREGLRRMAPCAVVIAGLGFSASPDCLLAAENDKQEGIIVLEGHPEAVLTAVWLPDGKHLLTGDWGANIFLWDVEARKSVGRFDAGINFIRSLNVSADGKRYVACTNNAVTVGVLPSGKELQRVSQLHGAAINMSADISPDGTAVATIISGRTVEITR
jgi:hypothetical protein